MAVANWVTPVMFQPWQLVGRLRHRRRPQVCAEHCGAALPRSSSWSSCDDAIVQVVNERWHPQGDDEAWIAGLARSLRHLKREHEACEVLRIASSPELTSDAPVYGS